jgi:hypothetical protein
MSEPPTPDPEELVAALRALDQHDGGELTLRGPDAWLLQIGGADDQFVAALENQVTGVRYRLVDADAEGDQRTVVDYAMVLRAAQHFASTGQADPELTWDEEQAP